jgi:hypothetical protein
MHLNSHRNASETSISVTLNCPSEQKHCHSNFRMKKRIIYYWSAITSVIVELIGGIKVSNDAVDWTRRILIDRWRDGSDNTMSATESISLNFTTRRPWLPNLLLRTRSELYICM